MMRPGSLVRKNTTLLARKLGPQCAVRFAHSKPPVMEQTEHIDTHVGGFVDYMEPSPAKREFGEYFKACLAKEGVDFQTLETKNYQMTVDEMEFDPPSPPRPDSEAWGYMFGNNLVEFKTMAETLTPDKEYKRGFFEFRIEPLIKKMKIHYNHLDWRSKYESVKKEWKEGKFTTFQKLKAEVLAKEVAADMDGYIDLYRSNSHFNFKSDDPYRYYMPVENEIKWTNLNRFEWDRTSQTADLSHYVEKLQSLTAAIEGPLKKTSFVAAAQAAISSTDKAMASAIVSAVIQASPYLAGEKLDPEQEISAVFAKFVIKEKLTAAQANRVSAYYRGANISGADLSGKTAAEAIDILKDTTPASDITMRYHATKVYDAVAADPAGVLVGTLFGTHTELFAQLFINEGDFATFVSSNESAFAAMVDSFAALNTTSQGFAKSLTKACASATEAMKKHGAAKADSAACVAGLTAAVEKANASGESFLAKKLSAMAQDLKARGSFLGNVNCQAAALYVDSNEAQSSAGCTVLLNSLYADADGFSGTFLQQAAHAATSRSFSDGVAASVAAHLVSSGIVPSASRDLTGAVETAFGELAETAEKVIEARAAACDSVMKLSLDIALKDMASLEIQYKC